MISETHSKIQSRHLKRGAYLYVRQSTLRQVFENTESTQRQYDLRNRALALGWRLDQIIVIDRIWPVRCIRGGSRGISASGHRGGPRTRRHCDGPGGVAPRT